MVRAAFAFVILVSAWLTPQIASAQTAMLPLADADSFREMMLDKPASTRGILVGASIVGIRLDGPARRYDPKEVRVALGSVPANEMLCVRFISRDGRYSAQGRYKLSAETPPNPVLEVKSSYEKQLGGYKTTDMAILAQSAKTCEGPKNANLFAVDLGASQADDILVQINAGDARVRAQLGQNNAAVSDPVVCTPLADDVRAGFTQDCRLRPRNTWKPGVYQLSIGETASTGEISVKTFGLTLYRSGT